MRRLLIFALATLAVAGAACGTVVDDPSPSAPPTSTPAAPDLPPPSPSDATAAPTPTAEPDRSTAFEGRVARVGPEMRERLVGRNWHPGCPVPIRDLRHVTVTYRTFRGEVRTGPLIVHGEVAGDVVWVFRQLFRARFPIHRIDLPPRYRPPRPEDRRNTRNLTSAFNCRPATGNPGSISHHSYGWAIDINPLQNPYVRSDGSVLRRAVKPFRDRTRNHPGMIHEGDVVVRSFTRIGWSWGGNWRSLKDYMHFSLTGR